MADETVKPTESDRSEFSVYQFFTDGSHERVREWVSAEEAVRAAYHYTSSIGVKLGFVERVIITDGSDSTVFEWKLNEGVTFPRRDDGRPK